MTDSAVTAPKLREPTAAELRLVIGASSAGTIFEWFDFFIYGTLAPIIGRVFFPSDNATLQTLLVWAGFAVGFGFRPLGAVLFGYLGDRLGRKYTFLVTVTLMGVATAGVGLIPSAASIGIAAPIIVIGLRILQGLALGGEYGGAAVYVAEHAPTHRRGFYTSFIQASVVGGFVVSLLVVLLCKAVIPEPAWSDWGWRVPFLLSLALLAISLWMRLKLSESPVFQAMKAEGELSHNPIREAFSYPGNKTRIFIALFGIAAGLTVIWYTAMFTGLSFLTGPMRIEETPAQLTVAFAATVSMGFYILAGHLSDKIGRKKPIVWGYVATLLLTFPLFWIMGAAATPDGDGGRPAVTVSATACDYDPIAKAQKTPCARTLAELTRLGVPYTIAPPAANAGDVVALAVGGQSIAVADSGAIKTLLERAGYDFAKHVPSLPRLAVVAAALIALGILSALTYGPVAALLAEMFPPRIRYSSLSIPYHIGTGYFGGFLPLISAYIIATTGDPYSGLWYSWIVVLMALLVSAFMLRETHVPDKASG